MKIEQRLLRSGLYDKGQLQGHWTCHPAFRPITPRLRLSVWLRCYPHRSLNPACSLLPLKLGVSWGPAYNTLPRLSAHFHLSSGHISCSHSYLPKCALNTRIIGVMGASPRPGPSHDSRVQSSGPALSARTSYDAGNVLYLHCQNGNHKAHLKCG